MTFEQFRQEIQEKFPEITPEQIEQFRRMEAVYREWNSKINVISRKDIDQLYRHHVMHSLCIAAFIKTQMPDVYGTLCDKGASILAASPAYLSQSCSQSADSRFVTPSGRK